MTECLKLTVFFGESDRAGRRLVSDALLDVFAEEGLHAAILLRAAEGFGLNSMLRTDRFLSLSEDLPLVAVAVDERARVEAVLPRVIDLLDDGLVTLERAQLLRGRLEAVALPDARDDDAKLTIYLGRDERIDGRPAFVEVVERLHRRGLAGATVLLGVDGTAHGVRRRARFLARNEDVPAMVVSVGSGAALGRVLPELGALLREPIATIEHVQICKRDGDLLAAARHVPERDEAGLAVWQKLTVYAGEQARHEGHPLAVRLVHRLREAGAGGATSLRGVWGFSGDHAPHGDRLFRIRRRVPVVTTVVDTPERIRRWFRIVDECTAETGLVTSELVPAYHAVAAGRRVGGLRPSRPLH